MGEGGLNFPLPAQMYTFYFLYVQSPYWFLGAFSVAIFFNNYSQFPPAWEFYFPPSLPLSPILFLPPPPQPPIPRSSPSYPPALIKDQMQTKGESLKSVFFKLIKTQTSVWLPHDDAYPALHDDAYPANKIIRTPMSYSSFTLIFTF